MLFFVFLISFSYILPSVVVVVLYKKIIDKLKELTKNLNKDKPQAKLDSANYTSVLAKIKRNRIQNVVSSVLGSSTIFTIATSNITETTQQKENQTEHQEEEKDEKKRVENPNNHFVRIRENKNPKQRRFAQQMVLINLLTGIGSVFSLLTNIQVTLSTNPYFDYLNKLLQNVSPMFRVIFLCIQSTIPVISIIYSPWSYSWRDIKKKIINSELLTSNKTR